MSFLHQPVSILYLFPNYQTREAYKLLTGRDAPTYDPTLPVKGWEDLDIRNDENRRVLVIDVMYNYTIARFADDSPVTFPDQSVVLQPKMVDKVFAGRVNIPPKSVDQPSLPAPHGEIYTPLRALKPTERIVSTAFGMHVEDSEITDPQANEPAPATGGLTFEEAAMLRQTFNYVEKIFQRLFPNG